MADPRLEVPPNFTAIWQVLRGANVENDQQAAVRLLTAWEVNHARRADQWIADQEAAAQAAEEAECYASQQTYVKVNDTYSEGGTHEETLHPQSKARVMNKRQGD